MLGLSAGRPCAGNGAARGIPSWLGWGPPSILRRVDSPPRPPRCHRGFSSLSSIVADFSRRHDGPCGGGNSKCGPESSEGETPVRRPACGVCRSLSGRCHCLQSCGERSRQRSACPAMPADHRAGRQPAGASPVVRSCTPGPKYSSKRVQRHFARYPRAGGCRRR